MGKEGSVIIAEKFRNVVHGDEMLPKVISMKVEERIRFKFALNDFIKLRKNRKSVQPDPETKWPCLSLKIFAYTPQHLSNLCTRQNYWRGWRTHWTQKRHMARFWAKTMLEGGRISNTEQFGVISIFLASYFTSLRTGPVLIVLRAETQYEEVVKVAEQIRKWRKENPAARIGILVRSKHLVNQIIAGMESHDIDVTQHATVKAADDTKVRVLTMHNAKGLEFNYVVLMGVSKDAVPQRYVLAGAQGNDLREGLLRNVHCCMWQHHVPEMP
ncbi:3'-5' exonuclease [Corynebacterium sp. HS2168-gen11]|uniref:3'-5' exonuclease n=1 Tax=Corynebacterium sp. HS2168-gen11 TaxID=2974027 RepID=UPI00216AD9A4|nr:3'-5' exonuclease [Corynebacterium sp. HS2168-gen11]MCS4536498.1 hypothetical protein [Corynebacterium sp. HS2168-gen11]